MSSVRPYSALGAQEWLNLCEIQETPGFLSVRGVSPNQETLKAIKTQNRALNPKP